MRDGLVRAEFRQQVQESSVEKLYYVGGENKRRFILQWIGYSFGDSRRQFQRVARFIDDCPVRPSPAPPSRRSTATDLSIVTGAAGLALVKRAGGADGSSSAQPLVGAIVILCDRLRVLDRSPRDRHADRSSGA